MFEFIEDLFYDWTTTGICVWLGLSFGIIYAAWFINIPSAVSDSVGFPFIVKMGVTIFIPIITYFMIQNKEWTASKFGGPNR